MSPVRDSPQAAAQPTQFCLNCHGQNPPAAKGMPLIAASFKKDNPHQEISCLTCHPGGARYPHNGQAAVDCQQCHPTRHDEKTAGGDLHLGVSCQACHLAGVKPWRDAKTGRVPAQPVRMDDGQTTAHSLAPAAAEATCARCHQPGNVVGAATMVLPAKSVICMPCHTAPVSAGASGAVVARVEALDVGAHQRRGVAGDVEAGLEAILQAHARHGLGRDAVPGRLGLEERFSRRNLVQIGSRSLQRLIADSTRLVVHVRDPFELICKPAGSINRHS
jgi:hypothetical protein